MTPRPHRVHPERRSHRKRGGSILPLAQTEKRGSVGEFTWEACMRHIRKEATVLPQLRSAPARWSKVGAAAVAVLATLGLSGETSHAQAQPTGPQCFINGGAQYPGCVPAAMVFRVENGADAQVFDTLESAIWAAVERTKPRCLYFGYECQGIYRAHISYQTQSSSTGQCAPVSTSGNFPSLTRSPTVEYAIAYRFSLYERAIGALTCKVGEQSVPAPKYNVMQTDGVNGRPVCPQNYKLLLEFPNQWSGNFGYFCAPPRDYALASSSWRGTCQDGPDPTCGEAGNPVDLARGIRKRETATDLRVAGDFPIEWTRLYAAVSTAMGTQDWNFPALKSADVGFDSAQGIAWAQLSRGNGGKLVFSGTGAAGARSWTPEWGRNTVGYRIRSTLADWNESGVHQGLVLSNDWGQKEFYGLNGRLTAVEDPQGRRHTYLYGNDGLLVRIEQDSGRGLDIAWQKRPLPNQSGSATHQEYDPGGASVPQTETFAYHSGASTRTDMMFFPVVRSVSDGQRTVTYEWHQTFGSAQRPLLKQVTHPDGRTRRYEHNALYGFISTQRDAADKPVAAYIYGLGGQVEEEWKGSLGATGSQKVDRLAFQSGSVTDGLGNTYTFSGSGRGQMWSYLTDCPVCRGPKAKQFQYDTAFNPVRTVDFNNVATAYTHDASGRMTSRTEAAGTALARTTAYTWVPGRQLPLTQTDPVLANGVSGQRVTAWQYDAAFRPTSKTVTAPDGQGSTVARQWVFLYGADGRLSQTTDAQGRGVAWRHSAHGDVTARIENPGTLAERLTRWGGHQADGLPRWELSPEGVLTLWAWDAAGRPVSARQGLASEPAPVDPDLGSTSWVATLAGGPQRATAYLYDAAGLLERVTLPDGTATVFVYDAVNRLVGLQERDAADALVSTAEFMLDAMSNVTATVLKDAGGQVVRSQGTVYDAQYRAQKALNAAQQVLWTQTYDGLHQPLARTDALQRTVSDQFDALGRAFKHLDAQNQAFHLTHGPQDEVLTATDARGVKTLYAYNGFGELLSIASPDRGAWHFTYDAAGRRTTATDPRGVVAANSYDAQSRPVATAYSDAGVAAGTVGFEPGSLAHTFVYDTCANGAGRLCGFSDSTGATAYVYDVWGEVVGKAWVGKAGTPAAGATLSTGYGFDPGTGKLTAQVLPSGKTIAIGHGLDGQVKSLAYEGQSVIDGVAWTAWGAVKGWSWPQAAGWSSGAAGMGFAYDLDGRLVETGGAAPRALAWDLGDRLTSIAADWPAPSQTFGYDTLDRLTTTQSNGSAAQAYGYDAVGNRTARGAAVGSWDWQGAYGATHNRLASQWTVVSGVAAPATALSYDAMGNLVDGGQGLVLRYDATGRLAHGQRGGSAMSAGYSALGQRVTKTTGSNTQIYVSDEDGRPLGVYRVDPAQPSGFRVEEEYLHLDGWRPVAVVRPEATLGMAVPQVFPIVSDHLGTPRQVLDAATGAVRWAWDGGEAFGDHAPNEVPSAGYPAFVFDLRFPGQRYDPETGLFQNGFRDYHPGLGRYVESDPIGLEGGWNTFGYAGQNPTKDTDFFGLKVFLTGDSRDSKVTLEKSILSLGNGSPSFSKMFDLLKKSKVNYVFHASDTDRKNGFGIGFDGLPTVSINKNVSLYCASNGGFNVDMLAAIAHETSHAYDFEKNRTARWWGKPGGYFKRVFSEPRATSKEGEVMMEMGVFPARGQGGPLSPWIDYYRTRECK